MNTSMVCVHKAIFEQTTLTGATLALIAIVGLTGCKGWMAADHERDEADAAVTSPEESTSDGGPMRDTERGVDAPDTEEPETGEPDPNTLDQDRLFRCEEPSPAASPARIRRLTPAQFYFRFVPPPSGGSGTPYSSEDRFRYSTNTDDARMDTASAEQMLLYGMLLGEDVAARRGGWKPCMQQATYQPERDRPTRACMEEWAAAYLKLAWQRDATAEEIAELVDYANISIDQYGDEGGLAMAAAQPFLDPKFLFKDELGAGEPDADGRLRMGRWQIARAIAAAITDEGLIGHYYRDEIHVWDRLHALREAAEADELQTREQVEAHVRAFVQDPLEVDGDPEYSVLPSNLQRFFREYLGHPQAPSVFKSGGDLPQGEASYIYYLPGYFPQSVDRTIAALYQEDEQFLLRLLTTRDYFIGYMLNENGWAYNIADGTRDTQENITLGMITLPADERAGMLTHPAWLAAHSKNLPTDPHPVHRGKWIYENMLCNAMPQLPITVEAQLPDLPTVGVRERLESVTGPDEQGGYCWNCHKRMDPLGIPFEQYSHYGRYRTQEKVGDGSLVPVDAATTLAATGDPALDGKQVANAVELAELLASSERVEGCFVRNVFRYFMGRNETYADACILTQMRDAYRDNGGSFQEMLVTLLTSDTFLYRQPIDHSTDEAQP